MASVTVSASAAKGLQWRVTMRDVARQAKMSVASVSRAPNGTGIVTEKTRQRTLRIYELIPIARFVTPPLTTVRIDNIADLDRNLEVGAGGPRFLRARERCGQVSATTKHQQANRHRQ